MFTISFHSIIRFTTRIYYHVLKNFLEASQCGDFVRVYTLLVEKNDHANVKMVMDGYTYVGSLRDKALTTLYWSYHTRKGRLANLASLSTIA